MKKLIRLSLIAVFALTNLAVVAAPADAWRKKNAECEIEGDEGEIGVCCISCWFLCDDCTGMET